jgi:hypothetical protein
MPGDAPFAPQLKLRPRRSTRWKIIDERDYRRDLVRAVVRRALEQSA